MTNVPATQNSNVPATQSQQGQEQILKSDIVLPKILLMQALSDFVKEKKAQAGDIVRSGTGEMLAKDGAPLEFIPLTYTNLWMLSEDEKGKGNKQDYKFRGYEERNGGNEDLEWDFMQDGTRWKRTKVMNLYALLASDIEKFEGAMAKFKESGDMPDLDAALLPVTIQFRNTSFKAAKDVSTLFLKAKELANQMQMEVPAYGRTMKLQAVEESKNDNDYYVLTVTGGSTTKKEYLPHAKRWKDTIAQMGGKVKVDESDLSGAVAEAGEVFSNQF